MANTDTPEQSPSQSTDNDETVDDASGGRDIVVPMRLYKTITVFSTLIAVVCVVLGFILLDAATLSISILRGTITSVFAALGIGVDDDVLTALLAILGLATIGFGAGVYIIGTRFRARGMGKSQEDSDEGSDNG